MSAANVSTEWRKDSGLFYGHFVYGAIFVIGSFLWVLKYYFIKGVLRQNDGSEKRRLSMKGIFRAIPWEGCIFLSGGCGGIITNFCNQYFILNMVGNDGKFVLDSLRGWQHTTEYVSLALYGLFIVLADTKFSSLVYYIKPIGSVTFAFLATTFAFHSTMKDPVDSQIHNILVLCGYGIAISFAFETAYPTQKIFFMMRVFFTLLQGTWLMQSAFIIDPRNFQPWDGYDKLNIMFVSTSFFFHFVSDFWVVIFIFCCLMPNICRNEKREIEYSFLEDKSELGLIKVETDLGV
ncbi:Transmembrane protein 45B [Holothuria leucospilota]|uniref:Transmembrane protein 45B n=1 Tax=Holothuria leucospilota TaxID=206669 RepID=A0A9Q0YDR7_HOLLE|nr:Transmembrane protein 45B [Holothuria leucospilota]